MIRLLPIGRVDVDFLPRFLGRLEDIFEGFQTRLEGALNLEANWYDDVRSQYYSTKILRSLAALTGTNGLSRLLGITQVDLYVPSLNFVFGEAECPGNVAVVSMFRLHPKFYGQVDGSLLFQRTLKEAVHELGHTFGLTHCNDPYCVMTFSNNIYDTDQKHEAFCPSCRQLVRKTLERE
jgi:archaemetzincin